MAMTFIVRYVFSFHSTCNSLACCSTQLFTTLLTSQVGDCLSVHAVPNPDPESEINLLRSYAPGVDESLLRQIALSFDELRRLSEQGDLTYPYSTREAGT